MGNTLMELPWSYGGVASFWLDATSPDTFASSYVSKATSEAEAVAAVAEDRKMTKYKCLEPIYTFTPIAIEIMIVAHWHYRF